MLNTIVQSYVFNTRAGFDLYLSLSDGGVCFILTIDNYCHNAEIHFFTNFDAALDYINSL